MVEQGSPRGRVAVRMMVGAVVGLMLGVIVDAALWIWAFSQALSGRAGQSIPFVVSTEQHGQDVWATSGPGVLLIPVVLAAIGTIVGLAIRPARR